MTEQKIPVRAEVPEENTWRLEDIFPTDEAWKAEYEALQKIPEQLAAYAGHLGESAERLLTASDIAGMSDDDIQLAINTIYARHGYQFKDSELLQYFKGFDWYQPSESDMEKVKDSFSEIERKNMEFLAASR